MMDFLQIPQRPGKPRSTGLTLIRDQGETVARTRDQVESYGGIIDYAKIKQFILFHFPDAFAKEKIAIYEKAGIKTFTGGTVFELALLRGKSEETLAALVDFGFSAIELSANLIQPTLEDMVDYTGRAKAHGLEVLWEYGSKYPTALPEADIAVAEIERLLDAGASLIILERSLLDLTFETVNDTSFIDRLFSAIGRERLVFEAESVDQQMALLRMFGKDVNIGPNLAVEEVVNILEPARNGLGRREGFSLIAAELGRAAE